MEPQKGAGRQGRQPGRRGGYEMPRECRKEVEDVEGSIESALSRPEKRAGIVPREGGFLGICRAVVRAALFNRRAMKDASSVLACLNVAEGSVIADIGSGGGLFALELARLAGPAGRVFAVDVDEALLDRVVRQARRRGLLNLVPFPCDPDGPRLPEKSCDLLFMRNVFHHLADPTPYLSRIGRGLKSGGRLAIVERRPGRHGWWRHSTEEAVIRASAEKAGFRFVESRSFFEDQSFTIFTI